MAPLSEAFVRVRPDTTGFRQETEKQIGPIRVKAKVAPDLTRFNADLRTQLRALPQLSAQVRVTPDTSGFNAALRAKLAALPTLSTKAKVNVAVDTTTALAALAKVEAAATRLDGRTISLRVNANTAATSAALAKLKAEATALGATRIRIHVEVTGNLQALAAIAAVHAAGQGLSNLNPTLNINTGGAVGGTRLLITLIQLFGAAAVPATAAAAGGLVAVAAAATSAAAGLVVAVVAFRGVADAVKAVNKAKSEQTKTNATLARQDKALAGSADQVRSAVAALANTRANAAESARRAAAQVADAERGLASAQRDALRAQLDVTRAREEARQALEDLGSAVANNSLSIRQANLDLVDAKAALDRVLADPTASRRQREEAQLTYDRAVQQLQDLTVRQGRLAAEQAEAARAGVDGSRQVVAAQERVADSQQRVEAAERALTEARVSAAEQQRQAAYSIQQAQQAVEAAQRSAATAAVAAGATAGAAMDDLAEKMAALGPHGQRFVAFLVALGPVAKRVKIETERIFPGIQDGLTSLLKYEQPVLNFIGRMGDGLGNIARRQLEAFGGQEWRPFFTYIDRTAVPTLDLLAEAFGNVALGTGNLIVGFAETTAAVETGLLRMTERYVRWSQALEDNQQFQRFAEYVRVRGPETLATIGSLVDGLLAVAEAAAPVGEVTLAVLRAIGDTLNAVPTDILTALVAGFVAMKVAAIVAPGVIALGAGVRSFATGAVTARAAAMGLVTALGGPVTLAVAAATVAIGLMAQRSIESKAKMDALRGSLNSYADLMRDGFTPEAAAAAQAMLGQNTILRDLINTLGQAGVAQKTLAAALGGDAKARDVVVEALNRQIAAEKEAAKAALEAGDKKASIRHDERAEALGRERDAVVQTSNANAEAARQVGGLRREYDRLPAAQQTLIQMYQVLNEATATATQRSQALRTAWDQLFGAAVSQSEAAEAYARATIDLTKTVDDNTRAHGALGRTLDINTEAGLRNRDAIEARLQASRDMYLADVAAGVSTEEATRRHNERTKALIEEARRAGLNTGEVQKLINVYGQVPTDVNTQVRVLGVDEAMAELTKMRILQLSLQGVPFDQAVKEVRKQQSTAAGVAGDMTGVGGRAQGGPVYGPGGPTEDKVPALLPTPRGTVPYRLSDGEWVHRAAAVRYYGQHTMAAINNMAIPKEVLAGAAQYRARGGLVEWPFPVDATRTKIPSAAEIRASAGAGTYGGAEAIKAFIRRADALPYIWAAAGPHGYDCSGLTGAVYGMIRGLPGAGRGARYFTTHNFARGAPAGFVPGVGGVYTVGVNPQSHMAGEYGGLKFEAASSRSGIKVGPSARDVRTFQKQFHLGGAAAQAGTRAVALASGGLVSTAVARRLGVDIGGDPSGMTIDGRPVGRLPLDDFARALRIPTYDMGGLWPAGTIGVNTSGRTEHVTTGDGMDRVVNTLERLIAAVERVAPGVGRELRGTSRDLLHTARAR